MSTRPGPYDRSAGGFGGGRGRFSGGGGNERRWEDNGCDPFNRNFMGWASKMSWCGMNNGLELDD